MDNVACIAGDRVFLNAQTATQENGPWVLAAGSWSRPSDFSSSAQVKPGMICPIGPEGEEYGSSIRQLRSFGSITLGTTGLIWRDLSYAAPRRPSKYLFNPTIRYRLDQPIGSLYNSLGTLPFTATGGSGGGSLYASTDDGSVLGTGSVGMSGFVSPFSAYARTPHSALVPATNQMALCCWVQAIGTNTNISVIAGYADNTTILHFLGLTSAGNFSFTMTTVNSGTSVTATSSHVFVPGEPYFIAGTYSPTDQRIRIIVNGEEHASTATSGGNVQFGSSGDKHYLLFNNPNNPDYLYAFYGQIEEFLIFDQALPDLRGIYNRGIGRPGRG